MPWFKVDDGLHSSKKLLSIPRRHRFAAIGLWTIAGSWCADQVEDGLVPEHMLTVWGATPAAVEALVSSGLWDRESGAYQFRNWSEYQPTKADVDKERAASRERMRDLRAKRKGVKPREQRDAEECAPEQERTPDERYGSPTHPSPIPVPTQSPIREATPRKRAARLPDGWKPERDLVEAMQTECPYVDQPMEHRKFTDYWNSQPDSKARKTDWSATYRNWIRRAGENAPKSANRATDRMQAGYQAMSGYQGPTEDPWARPKELGA